MMKYSASGVLLAAVLALPVHAATQTDTAKSTKAKATHTTAKAAPAAAPEVVAPVELTPEQLAISSRVYVGKIPCELGAVVNLVADAQSPGRFILETGRHRFVLAPVVSSTGAIRLEDASGGAVWLQLGNKSMLMDQKEGKRLADDCMSPDQLAVAQAMERNPTPGLLDAPKDALVPVGSGGKVQEMVPNPGKTKTKAKAK